MYQPPIKSSSKAAKSRLSLKVAALFLGTFLAVFLGLLFLDLVSTFGENALVDAAISSQPPATAIDPKLETDLAKVLDHADPQTTAEIRNPFADTTGISDKTSTTLTTTSSNAARPNANAPTANTAAAQAAAQRNQPSQPQQQDLTARSVAPDQNVNARPQEETRRRLQLREERMRLGQDGGPESAVFAIDDLLPVGTVSGGGGKDEVLFYSQSACRVVSFPVGAQLHDGWVDSLRPEGVVFRYFDQLRIPPLRQWERSNVSKCSEKVSEQTSPNPSSATQGGD
jgi:hypothetical protein